MEYPGVAPAGHQPRGDDGRLQCLDCGNWYRLLAPHLARAHATTTAEYRETHRLPRTLSLRAADLTAAAREQGAARYASRPDIRANLAAGRQTLDPRNGAAGTKATATYEMTLAAHHRGGQTARKTAARRIDGYAQRLGFDTIGAYFEARQGMPVARMARELGAPRTSVRRWMEQARGITRGRNAS